MKYLSNNRMFVGIYPNKFYIFEINDNNIWQFLKQN
jgi:hypothetical protein